MKEIKEGDIVVLKSNRNLKMTIGKIYEGNIAHCFYVQESCVVINSINI